jgi:hypothetical protein
MQAIASCDEDTDCDTLSITQNASSLHELDTAGDITVAPITEAEDAPLHSAASQSLPVKPDRSAVKHGVISSWLQRLHLRRLSFADGHRRTVAAGAVTHTSVRASCGGVRIRTCAFRILSAALICIAVLAAAWIAMEQRTPGLQPLVPLTRVAFDSGECTEGMSMRGINPQRTNCMRGQPIGSMGVRRSSCQNISYTGSLTFY